MERLDYRQCAANKIEQTVEKLKERWDPRSAEKRVWKECGEAGDGGINRWEQEPPVGTPQVCSRRRK